MKENIKKLSIRNYRAFTLVELLVVISIIALLLSILMPSLQKAREQAQRLICATNLKNLGIATQTYILENNEEIYFAQYLPSPGSSMDNLYGGGASWEDFLLKEVYNTVDYFYDPSKGGFNKEFFKYFFCSRFKPSDPAYLPYAESGYATTYAYNYDLLRIYHYSTSPNVKPLKPINISGTSRCLLLTCGSKRPGTWLTLRGVNLDRYAGYDNHGGRSNFMFLDGHVKAIDSKSCYDNVSYSYVGPSRVLRPKGTR